MKKTFVAGLIAFGIASASLSAHAHGELSALSALSALPIASVGAVAGSAVAAPLILSTAGAVLVVKSVEASARGAVLVLERASDGARASVDISGRGIVASGLAVGTVVTASVIGAGIVLCVASEVIAFIPNALGQALLHNERLTY